MVTNMLSRWVKMFFLIGTMEVRKSLRRMKNEDGTGRGKNIRRKMKMKPRGDIIH